MMDSVNTPQPPPAKNAKHPAVWELVVQDMIERDSQGAKKYGTRLQPFNGRDGLVDAYQEILDLAVYLRQLIFERHEPLQEGFRKGLERAMELASKYEGEGVQIQKELRREMLRGKGESDGEVSQTTGSD